MKLPSTPPPMSGTTYGLVSVQQTPSSPRISPCAVRPTPAASEDGGLKRCTSTKETPVSHSFPPISSQERHTYTLRDMRRQANRCTGESSSQPDLLTIRTLCGTDSTRPCSSPSQKWSESVYSMETGTLQKVVHSQSSTSSNMLSILTNSQQIGPESERPTTVTQALRAYSGVQSIGTTTYGSIENLT